jgi:hypothetical protein
LPKGLSIAHKTGTLHDTLNDVGIVFLGDEPYVIAVMTTHLPDLEGGRRFIRHVSRLAFTSLERFAHWRVAVGMPAFTVGQPALAAASQPLAPDIEMWNAPADTPGAPAAEAAPPRPLSSPAPLASTAPEAEPSPS